MSEILEKELAYIKNFNNNERIICPFCNYETKQGRGTAKVFVDEGKRRFKCFNCGVWRSIK